MFSRKPLFSVTAADCRFDYVRGSGAGGQKRNKTSSAVRCTHLASGAVGYSEGSRSQRQNKEEAFSKMAYSEKFRTWNHLEAMRRTGEQAAIEEKVSRMMRDIRVEVKQNGKWVEESSESR